MGKECACGLRRLTLTTKLYRQSFLQTEHLKTHQSTVHSPYLCISQVSCNAAPLPSLFQIRGTTVNSLITKTYYQDASSFRKKIPPCGENCCQEKSGQFITIGKSCYQERQPTWGKLLSEISTDTGKVYQENQSTWEKKLLSGKCTDMGKKVAIKKVNQHGKSCYQESQSTWEKKVAIRKVYRNGGKLLSGRSIDMGKKVAIR